MEKPQKPYPDFPLYAHQTKRWAKKIKGQTVYFGSWDDPDGALAKYEEQYGDGSLKDQNNVPPTKKAVKGLPQKPRQDFPLYAHRSGKWCIKIKGKSHYFGRWDNPDGALQEYLDVKDDLLAGRPIIKTGGVTVRELCNRFLNSKQRQVDSGELKQDGWEDYYDACEKVIKVFGKGAKVANLRADDFEELRASLWAGKRIAKRAPKSVAGDIGRIRVIFNYAEDKGLILGRIQYGKSFNKPNAKTLRKAKIKNGRKKFESDEIHKMLNVARQQIKAMILLGINCGFGNTDCTLLTADAIKGTWVELPRSKTAIERRCPLWPEAMEALKTFKWGKDTIFTTQKGNTWEPKATHDNPLSKEMVKLMKKADVYQKGRNFYALRHTFNTIGLRMKDTMAVKYIMGHTPDGNDMTANYNQEPPPDEDLLAVTEYVRKWLFGE